MHGSANALRFDKRHVRLTKYGLRRARRNVGRARSVQMKPQIMFLQRGSITFLRPVANRSIGGILHVAAMRQVCCRPQPIWLGFGQRVPSQKHMGGQEVAVAAKRSWRVPRNIQTPEIEQRWQIRKLLSTPEGADWTTRTASCGGCLARASCPYPPALSSAIASNRVLWRLIIYEMLSPENTTQLIH